LSGIFHNPLSFIVMSKVKTYLSKIKGVIGRLTAVSLTIYLCSVGTVIGAQGTNRFSVEVNGVEINLPLFSIFTAPQDTIAIKTNGPTGKVTIRANNRNIAQDKPGIWMFKAPYRFGLYKLECHDSENDSVILLNIFVVEPLERIKSEKLEQYRIGSYPLPREIKKVWYESPKGLVRVTEESEDLMLTPHFRISQFLCKQQSDYPKYVIVQEKLLLLLEALLTEVNRRGYNIATFSFISGYRTPFYNHEIENVKYSRHIYGDAADIYIDADNDGRMDDLNGDGKIDIADAKVLYDIAETLTSTTDGHLFTGGLGAYQPTSFHSEFVHVDTRGSRLRW